MQPQHNRYGTRTLSRFHRITLGTLSFIMGMMFMVAPSHGESPSLSGQIANSRIVGQISSALFTYTSRVEALAHDDEHTSWAWSDAAAAGAYRRLVWYVSALQMSATAAEVDEFAEIQQMIGVYRELHDGIVASAKAGDRAATNQTAKFAAAVIDEVHASLQRIENRGYNNLHDAASRLAALN
jgi:hypothetical protein